MDMAKIIQNNPDTQNGFIVRSLVDIYSTKLVFYTKSDYAENKVSTNLSPLQSIKYLL